MAVSATNPREDNTLPLVVGYRYLLTPGYPSGQWVTIYALDARFVYARGVYPNHADYKVLRTTFDDNVKEYEIGTL